MRGISIIISRVEKESINIKIRHMKDSLKKASFMAMAS